MMMMMTAVRQGGLLAAARWGSAFTGACLPLRHPLTRLGLASAWLLSAQDATAHVKWFASYNVAADPTPLPEIASGTFLLFLAASLVLIGLVYFCDRLMEDSVAIRLFEPITALAPYSADILRITLGAFMLSIWTKGGAILTPELQTESYAVAVIQLTIAICTLSWRTTWISGLGIVVLYIISVVNYGIFHLLDYPLFLGIAAYLVITSLKIERLKPYALSILYVAMSATLLWASIEKWAFGAWTMPLLTQYDRITFGIDHRAYMIIAGFVEFGAAFLLLYGRTSQRLAAMLLLFVFMSAIVEFGKTDAIGHSMIMAALAIVAINGNTIVNKKLQNKILSKPLGAFELGVSYLSCLVFFFIVYYTAHGIIYNSWA